MEYKQESNENSIIEALSLSVHNFFPAMFNLLLK